MKIPELEILNSIAQVIYDRKGFNILALDVRGLSSITDYLVIAEGNVDRHVIAIARTVEEKMRQNGMKPIHIEGLGSGDWVVLDYPGIMIHLFMPGLREAYSLEKLWKEGELVDLNINYEKAAPSSD